MQLKYLSLFVIVIKISCKFLPTEGQAVFPTQSEQVNLLTNVHELFKEIKQSINAEQTTMDESMKTDLELMMKRSRFTAETLQELTILKLITRSNSVCALDAKDEIDNILSNIYQQLEECSKTGIEGITKNSLATTNLTETVVKSGDHFLDKLDQCSTKRGLAVIACYRKVIQNDVVPIKNIFSEAIKSHEIGHLKAYRLKAAVSICVDKTIDELKDELEKNLEKGLNCT